MQTKTVNYYDGDVELEGYLAYDPSRLKKQPIILIAHAFSGRTSFENKKAEALCQLGYAAFAVDMYGKGVCVVEWAEKGLSMLSIEHLLIELSYLSDTERSFQLKPSGKRYREIVVQLKVPLIGRKGSRCKWL